MSEKAAAATPVIKKAKVKNKVGFDRMILLVALALMGISVVLISSASVMESLTRFNDPMYFLKRQLVYVAAALFLGLVCAAIPTGVWKKYNMTCMFLTIVLLILVLIIGREVNEAKRWIHLGFINIQPAEILKLCWILYFSSYTCRKINEVQSSLAGFIKPMIFIAVISLMLLAQPDFGSLVVVTCITFGILFVAGAGLLKYIATLTIVGVIGGILVMIQPYRMRRILSFLDPWEDQFGAGYQLTQSLMAFGRGGLTGEGLGNSIQKLGYLPEAHTDFVTAILGEEFGFIGMSVVILLEFILVYKAIVISFNILRKAPLYHGYVAFGIGVWFCLQTVINIGAASGALPAKGLTLPLVSYGGSSLFVSIAAIAILLRIDFEWRNGSLKADLKESLQGKAS